LIFSGNLERDDCCVTITKINLPELKLLCQQSKHPLAKWLIEKGFFDKAHPSPDIREGIYFQRDEFVWLYSHRLNNLKRKNNQSVKGLEVTLSMVANESSEIIPVTYYIFGRDMVSFYLNTQQQLLGIVYFEGFVDRLERNESPIT
jgi:hypothetical protein